MQERITQEQLAVLFNGKKIRTLSFETNTSFTVTPTEKKQRTFPEILEYAYSKVHEDLEGIVTRVAHLKSFTMDYLLKEQNDPENDYLLVVSKVSSYMLDCRTGIRVWQE